MVLFMQIFRKTDRFLNWTTQITANILFLPKSSHYFVCTSSIIIPEHLNSGYSVPFGGNFPAAHAIDVNVSHDVELDLISFLSWMLFLASIIISVVVH